MTGTGSTATSALSATRCRSVSSPLDDAEYGNQRLSTLE